MVGNVNGGEEKMLHPNNQPDQNMLAMHSLPGTAQNKLLFSCKEAAVTTL
jgi:hypothetical protein